MSVVLIGMPGAGKTTLGETLAAHLALPFMDTDSVIEQQTGRSLQASLDQLGYQAMRELEGKIVAQCVRPVVPSVIATGGSVVYSDLAMRHLKSLGFCVYLQVSLHTLETRVTNWQSRGFSAAPGESLASVYAQREPLYKSYCDAILECDALTLEQCLQRLKLLCQSHKNKVFD